MQEVTNDAWNWAHDMGFTNPEGKLAEEAREFCEAPSLGEAADVFIALVVACHKHGWTSYDLTVAAETKMAVNRNRLWAQTDDGTWHHI